MHGLSALRKNTDITVQWHCVWTIDLSSRSIIPASSRTKTWTDWGCSTPLADKQLVRERKSTPSEIAHCSGRTQVDR